MKFFVKKLKLNLLIVIISTLVVLILSLLPMFEYLELKSYDLRFRLRGEIPTSTDIILVTIDDQTYASLNQRFPYPRSLHARLVNNLVKAKARLIVFDFEFDTTQPYDELFANAIENAGNVLLSAKLVSEKKGDFQINRLIRPTPILSSKCVGIGLVGVKKDSDGFLRQYLLWQKMETRSQLIPSLALQTVNSFLESTGQGNLIFTTLETSINGKPVPKIGENSFLINYRGAANSFNTIPYESVIDDREFNLPYNDTNIFEKLSQRNVFENKIVLIGISTPELADRYLTPFFSYAKKQSMSGVEVHANAINTLLNGETIRKQGGFFRLSILILLMVISAFLITALKPPYYNFALIGLIICYLCFAIFLFINQNLWIDVILPFFQIFLIGFSATTYFYQIELRQQKKLSQFVPQHILEKIKNKPELLTPGGQRKELTMLFCDIRGFTAWSKRQEPEELVLMINEYFDAMANIITRSGHDGNIKDFVGDGVFAFFGEPMVEHHAVKAVSAGLEMSNRFAELCQKWESEGRSIQAEDSNRSIGLAIGINTGYVTIGNFGFKSINMMTYSVIGNNVNLASRIVDHAAAGQILIAERTRSLIEHQFEVRRLEEIKIKGKREPVILYQVLKKIFKKEKLVIKP